MALIMPMMAFKCSDDQLAKPEDEAGKAPVITMATSSVLIYPAEFEGIETIDFEAPGANDVVIDTDFDVKTELIKKEGDNWQIVLSEAKGMADGQKYYVTISAKNEYGRFERKRPIYKAYLSNPFDQQTYSVSEGGQTFSFAALGNVKWTAKMTAAEADWYELNTNASSITLSIKSNPATEPRSLVLKLADVENKYQYTVTFEQARCAETQDEILEKENKAMLALNKALNLGCDTSKHHTKWGVAQYNSKGYVTNIVLRGFSGYIPEEIGDLKYCWEFHLIHCNLSGGLPKRIGEMHKLKSLYLQGCGLEGDLAESTLSNVVHQLSVLSLGWNNFTGQVPEWIGDAPEYCNISIRLNRLSGKVPEKVQKHPDWIEVVPDGSGKTGGQYNMEQQEGYFLYE